MAPSRGNRDAKGRLQSNPRSSPKSDTSQSRPLDKHKSQVPRESLESSSDGIDLPISLQQSILTAFASIVPQVLESGGSQSLSSVLPPILQEVKGHLYNRDFAAAFGKPEYLAAYAIRWSASRAVGYARILSECLCHLPSPPVPEPSAAAQPEPIHVVALGGGAGAELVALAGVHRIQNQTDPLPSVSPRGLNIDIFDSADWTAVHSTLLNAVLTPPPLSAYASASARAANKALVDSSRGPFDAQFSILDLLDDEKPMETLHMALHKADVITLFFTLNELYTSSPPATQRLLLDLSKLTKQGALLLVVDSPGSYANVALNAASAVDGAAAGDMPSKKYPMRWLLEHTLFRVASKAFREGSVAQEGQAQMWECVSSTDSCWFRLPKGSKGGGSLEYPVELEDMRAQVHLYRKT